MSTTALPLAIASSSSSLADHPADGALSNDSAQFWRPDPKAERRRASPAQIVLELLRPSPVHALLLGNAGAAHDSSGPIWRQHKRPISYPLKPEALPQQALSLG